jgi:hypothetical protein
LKTKFISLILSVAVILGLMLVPAALPTVVSANPADEWTYKIAPNLTKVGFDTDFAVNVSAVRYEGNSSSYFLAVEFNATLLEVTAVDTPSTLPNGDTPSMSLGYPLWDNAAGFVAEQYSMQPPYEAPFISTTFVMCTIHFRSLSVEGTSDLNFANVDITNTTKIKYMATDTTNWTKMVNGTVMIGSPELTLDISPGSPPYPMATGGLGIATNMSDPLNPDYMLTIYPYDPLPNYTSWGWDRVLIVAAVDMIPGWGFAQWTGDPGIGDFPPEVVEVGGVNYTIYPRTIMMTNDKSLTAHFTQLEPEILVAPPSLFFNPFQNINPPNQTLKLWNSGGKTLNWSMTDDADYLGWDWLSELPASGSLTTNFAMPNQTVDICVNVSGMPADDYSAYINITEEGDPANFTLVQVNMTIKPATAVDNFRDIIASTDSGKPGETTELYAGETFDVYVNFTAPPTDPNNGFNAIGLTDVAPNGWTVTVNKDWCWIDGSPASALKVNALGNKAEIMLSGPYDAGTTISLMYRVTVPTTATPGLNTWYRCPDASKAWLEYYFNDEGPYTNCISGDWNVTVTQPGNLVGVTREVNTALLSDVDVQLLLVGPGYLRSDISTPNYDDTAWVTGTYWLVAEKTRWYTLNITDGVMLPGASFTIDLTTPVKLAAGNVFNFEGDYGLIPRAPTMSYALKSVNLWKFPPNAAWGLSDWKAMDVCNAWLYPS